VKAFLTAALLHDLGHFPFAHSLKELPLKEHEEMTAEKVLSEPLFSAIRDWVGTEPHMVAEIVDEKLPVAHGDEVRQYRRLLSGVLDPDKLDYLNRDAYFCGVPYGIQDTDYILHKVHLHPDSGVAIEADAVTAVENILFSKYLMYRTVYWHRVVRIATAMIKQAVYTGMAEGKILPEQLYWLDDEEFYHTFFSTDFPPFRLIDQVMRRQFYKTAYETAFDSSSPLLHSLDSLDTRMQVQERIASRISETLNSPIAPWEVVIDIPEPISFEVELFIKDGDDYTPFVSSGSVFSRPVVNGFTASLRKVRLFLPPRFEGRIKNPQELLQ
jgi:HD superfamily phosphohydrolase